VFAVGTMVIVMAMVIVVAVVIVVTMVVVMMAMIMFYAIRYASTVWMMSPGAIFMMRSIPMSSIIPPPEASKKNGTGETATGWTIGTGTGTGIALKAKPCPAVPAKSSAAMIKERFTFILFSFVRFF